MFQNETEIQKITLNKFCLGIEELINELVEESKVFSWQEDTITLKFLSQLRQRLNGSLISDMESRIVFLSPFKLRKANEKYYGDIGIIVEIEYGDGDKIEGIAFLEAKRKFKASRNYESLKWEQLERIHSNAPHSQLLLYDFRDISEFASTGLVSKKNATSSNPMVQLPVTKFVTIPINKAIQVKKKNESLYKLSLPISYQLGYRYMNGFDLDFTHDVLLKIKKDFEGNFIGLDEQVPKFLIWIKIVPEKSVKESKSSTDKKRMGIEPTLEINSDLYGLIRPNE